MDAISKLLNVGALSSLISINFGAQSLFALLVIVAMLLWGLSLGRTKIIVSILSVYIALGLLQLFPFRGWVYEFSRAKYDYFADIGMFIIIYVAVFLVFNFSFIRKRFSSSEFSMWQILLFNFLQVGLLSSIIISFLPPDLGKQLLGNMFNMIGSTGAVFGWAVAPLLVLLLGRSVIK